MKRVRRSQVGYEEGKKLGYIKGYEEGYSRGVTTGAAQFLMPLAGTSIIIPTYNKINYLRECIESIQTYTPQPYELIIIDNASTDGTDRYLRSLRGVRYRINPGNLGFAGSVNQGMMMARGETLMILNNDAVVTEGWLGNLLHCLHASPDHGIVGPMTNYISGDQQLDVTYGSMPEMQAFARSHNVSNPEAWQPTGRLTGFCMLMRRETFEQLGYFDEGFEIGNCEDDDYGLRARLLGRQLIIARDTFIHHYGSVSMKALDGQFDEVYGKNLQYYADKWADPHGKLSLSWQGAGGRLRTIDLYPTCVVVQGPGPALYWVEGGYRYQIDETDDSSCRALAVRVSRIDLASWPLGGVFTAQEVLHRLAALRAAAQEGQWQDGLIAELRYGLCQYRGGRVHRFLNSRTLTCWRFGEETISRCISDESLVEGPPIIAPPIIRSEHI